jgi:hypothetical protein
MPLASPVCRLIAHVIVREFDRVKGQLGCCSHLKSSAVNKSDCCFAPGAQMKKYTGSSQLFYCGVLQNSPKSQCPLTLTAEHCMNLIWLPPTLARIGLFNYKLALSPGSIPAEKGRKKAACTALLLLLRLVPVRLYNVV